MNIARKWNNQRRFVLLAIAGVFVLTLAIPLVAQDQAPPTSPSTRPRVSPTLGPATQMVRRDIESPLLVIRAETLHTMSGPPIRDGVVVCENGKITAVGPAASVRVPEGARVLTAKVVTPGLVDAHGTVGLTGWMNQPQDQDVLDRSGPIQPELRATDAYNSRDRLVEWVRSLGVTTMNTGHAPRALIPGQTTIVKMRTAEIDDVMLVQSATIAVAFGEGSRGGEGRNPGTRAKQFAMLRSELLKAQEYDKKLRESPEDKRPSRDLKLEMLAGALRGEIPLLLTAHRAHDILSALRLAEEFKLRVILDGAAEAYLVIDEIKRANIPVVLHPTMLRAGGETENLSFETAAILKKAGIRVAIQSGYEGYVPKSRVILLEAAIAAGHGLSFEDALGSVTIEAARILGIESRVGSIAVGKDADIALFDGDPFEYTTRCVATVIDGLVVNDKPQ